MNILKIFQDKIILYIVLAYYFNEHFGANEYYSSFCDSWLLDMVEFILRILLYDNPTMTNAEIFFSGYLMIFPSFISGIIIFDAYAKLLMLVLIAVSFADSAAYFFGKNMEIKFSLKNTSPGKTLEGLIGAFIATPIFLGLISGLVDIQFIWCNHIWHNHNACEFCRGCII